jgi:hypothetical protein
LIDKNFFRTLMHFKIYKKNFILFSTSHHQIKLFFNKKAPVTKTEHMTSKNTFLLFFLEHFENVPHHSIESFSPLDLTPPLI